MHTVLTMSLVTKWVGKWESFLTLGKTHSIPFQKERILQRNLPIKSVACNFILDKLLYRQMTGLHLFLTLIKKFPY